MRPITVETKTTTTVRYNDMDVDRLLEKICLSFHGILEECSALKHEIEEGRTVNEDDFSYIEGECCTMLDLLDD